MRLLGLVVGLALTFVAHQIAPRSTGSSRPRLSGAGAEWTHRLLGVARPYLAELRLLRYEIGQEQFDPMGQLDDAWSLLELRPDPDLCAEMARQFVLDQRARASAEPEVAARWVTAGFDLFDRGLESFPESPVLRQWRGLCLRSLVRSERPVVMRLGYRDLAAARFAADRDLLAALREFSRDSAEFDWLRSDLADSVAGELLENHADAHAADERCAWLQHAARELLSLTGLPELHRHRIRGALVSRCGG